MQVVIDISKETKEFFENHNCMNDTGWTTYLCELINAFRNGTPLPVGHGDLVDFDRLCKEYWDGNYMEINKDDLSNIKPIIEADGGAE